MKKNGWLCLTSHRQRGHYETAPPFTVLCEGREARFLHRPHGELNPGSSRGHNITAATRQLHYGQDVLSKLEVVLFCVY